MKETDSVLRFDILPDNIIFIDRYKQVQENRFEVSIVKCGQSMEGNASHGITPRIELSFPIGKQETDLCTLDQAGDIRVMQSLGDGDWRIERKILEEEGIFQCILSPREIEYTEKYSTAFLFYKLHTDLQRGTVGVKVKVSGFPDVQNCVTALVLLKEYPVTVRKFEVSPEQVELGQQVELRWEIEGARNCYIAGIGSVDPAKSKLITIDSPRTFTLTAVNYKGKPEYRECEVNLLPPQITVFKVDRELVWKDKAVTLTWETASSYQVYLEPGGSGPMPVKGTASFKQEKETEYRLTASGYDGKNVSFITKKCVVDYTGWEQAGTVKLPFPEENEKLNRRIFEWDKRLLLYGNQKIYTSEDGLSWTEKQTKPFPLYGKYLGYNAMLAGGKLYLTGGYEEGKSKEKGPCNVLINQLSDGSWKTETETQPPNQTWGSAANAGDVFLHGNLLGSSKILTSMRKENGIWSSVYIKEVDEIDAIQMLSWKGYFYLALRKAKGNVLLLSSLNGKGWKEEWEFSQEAGEWFFMEAWENAIYFMNKSGLCRMGDDKVQKLPVDSGGQCPYAGMINGYYYFITGSKQDHTQQQVWRLRVRQP